MKTKPHPTDQAPAPDPLQAKLDAMTDAELHRIAMTTLGRTGGQAYITLSNRSLARRPFRLK